jgi:hypothetical protein
MNNELTATLIVGRSSSRCGNCNKDVLPSETHHNDISGYSPVPGGGCGARFVNMRLDYRGIGEGHARTMRPDLPIVD